MAALNSVLIVGAGQAGYQAAVSLRQEGFAGRITMVGDELGVPYQRPPLSKAYLLGKIGAHALRVRPPKYFDEHRIERLHDRTVQLGSAQRKQLVVRCFRQGRPIAGETGFEHRAYEAATRDVA